MLKLNSFFKKNRWFLLMIGLSVIIIGAQQNLLVRSEKWKQDKIVTMYNEFVAEFPQVPSITVAEFKKLKKQNNLVVVDVRTEKERMVSVIPGAISKADFERNLDSYKDSAIVVYCTIGYRSGRYAQKLLKQGVNVLNLEGSLLAWSHIDGELVNSSGSTKQVHVFGKRWKLVAEDYQPIW